jgi:peptide/nickel transport system substrate-binding protein
LITRRQFFQMATAAAAPPLVPGLGFAASAAGTADDKVLQASIVPEPSGWVAGLNISNPAVIVSVNLFDGLEWARGNYVSLERNPDYWDKTNPPHFERIVFRIIPDAGARLSALQSGDLRYAPTDAVSLPDLVRLRKDPRFVVTGRAFDGIAPICFFDFNMRRKQFQDLRVRQAFAHAIDRDALARIVWYGLATPAQGPIPSYQTQFFKADLPQYGFDPARAEALLDAAGLRRGSDGVRLRINNLPLPFGSQYTLTSQFIQAQLRRIGVELQLVATDVPTFNRRAYADYDFDTLTNWYSAFADPQLGVTRRFWSKQIKPGSTSSNASGYATPEMDHAIEGLVSEADPIKRKPFIDAMQLIAQQQHSVRARGAALRASLTTACTATNPTYRDGWHARDLARPASRQSGHHT